MGKVHGKDAVVKLDNSAGSLVDLSSYGDNFSLSRVSGLVETTGFGDGGKKRQPGLNDDSITFSGSYDGAAAAIDAHLSAIYGHANTQTFEIGPEGGTTGKIKYSGECRLANYSVETTVDGRVNFSVELPVDGVTTRGTFA